MITSLRGRLLLWYTALLAAVVIVFGAMVCYLAWRARIGDVDERLSARAESLAAGLHPAAAGTFDLTLPPDLPDGADAFYHAIWTASGALIDRSRVEDEIPLPAVPGARTRDGRRELAVRAASGALVLAGMPLDDVYAEIGRLAGTMATVGIAALVVSLFGGWWLVGRALGPVTRINETARAMADGDFAARVPIDRVETELEQLARALNDAFDRLHESLERQRRFTADASHELRTPLATMSTEAQWALGRERTPDEYRRSLDVCWRAARRMHAIVERQLELARVDAHAAADRQVPLRVDDLVGSIVGELRPLAEARRLDVEVSAAPVVCLGDPDRLRDAVTNVIVNAVHYNVEGGRVRIEVRAAGADAEIIVTDTGIGIAPQHLPHVFEPFFRADVARRRDPGGAGLGLAVARATVQEHGGDVTCESEPGRGTTCRLRIPLAPGSGLRARQAKSRVGVSSWA